MKPAWFEGQPDRRARHQVRSASRKLRNRKQRRQTSFFSFEPLEDRRLLASLYDFSAGTFAANEGDATNTTNVVMLNRVDSSAAEDVDVVLTAGTTNPATGGTDFTAGPITVSFGVGETSKPVPIEILGETLVELDETIDLSLTNFSGSGQAGTTNPTATLTITNNDRATLSIGDASVTEGDSGTTTLSFPVTLDHPVDVDVSFDYEAADGTATVADSDFVAVNPAATFTIDAGHTNGTIDVTVNGDNNLESDETRTLVMTDLQASFRDVTLTGTVAVPFGGWDQLGQDIDGAASSDQAGTSVAMSANGKAVIIGSPYRLFDWGHARIFDWNGNAWVQRGTDIVGEASGDRSGYSVDMSSDGNTVIIGARLNDGGGSNSGHARIFEWNGTAWAQRGSDIDGEAAGNLYGYSVEMSADGNTVIIGALGNYARIVEWDGTAWVQKGGDIDGEALGDQFGFSVAMSVDGSTVIIGATGNDGAGSGSGHARIYSWDGTAWVQRGSDINGELASDSSGWSVDMSADGETVIIGARLNDGAGSNSGHARIHTWNGTAWVQQGSDINGEFASDESGYSVAMSADGNTVIIGARLNDGGGTDSGHARIYNWNGATWVQQGSDINGELANDYSGYSVDMSADGNTVVIGAYGNDGAGSSSGHARIYTWNGAAWVQQGSDINGELTSDQSGWSVAMSADGETVIIGATFNDGGGSNSGHARVYSWNGSDWSQVDVDIDGEAASDESGYSVAMSGDGSTVIIGARFNDGGGSNSGHARIFRRTPVDAVSGTITNDDSEALADVTFDLPSGGGDFEISVSGGDLVVTDGGGTVIFTTPLGTMGSLTLNGSDAADQITLDDTLDGLDVPVEINGGGGDDTIVVDLGGTLGDNLTIDGGAGTDSVQFTATGGTTIDGNLDVTADTITVSGPITTSGGDVSLQANGDIAINEAIITGGGNFTADADSDNNGTGTFTLSAATLAGFNEQAKLTADAAANDSFGFAVAISGDTAVVGARVDDDAGSSSGSAYVFTRNGSTWMQQSKLTAGDAAAADEFGYSVAISGDTAVVGAWLDDDAGSSSGSTYVFQESTGSAGGSIATGAGTVSITAAAADLQGPISGTSTLDIVPSQAASTIGLGGAAGTLNLDDSELGQLTDGFSSITIGNAAAGDITLDTTTFLDPLNLVSGGDVISSASTDVTNTNDTTTIAADLAPGGTGRGTFDVDGSVTFDSTARFEVNFNGPSDHDQLVINGDNRTTTLGGTELVITLDSVPAAGSQGGFRIVDSTGTGSTISGTFKFGGKTLNDGDEFTVGSTELTIHYLVGGDVTLTESGNTPPLIDASNTTLEYIESTVPQRDTAATASDSEVNWDGGTLVAQITANSEATDGLSIVTSGTNVTLDGSNVKIGGTTVGTTSAASVTAGAALTITFNAAAANADVQTVLRAIGFDSTSNHPSTAQRTVTFTLTDNVGASTFDNLLVDVTRVNDPPQVDLNGADLGTGFAATFQEGGAAVKIADTDASVTDLDHTTLGNLTVVVSNVTDGDGAWDNSAGAVEKIADSFVLSEGINVISFTVPAGVAAAGGDTFARFRLSQTGGLAATGYVLDAGEVEDYQLSIIDGTTNPVDVDVNLPEGGGAFEVTIDNGNLVVTDGDVITLDNPANDFAGAVSVTADDVTLADANDLTLDTVNATGSVGVETEGDVTVQTSLTVGGMLDIDTDRDNDGTGGDITDNGGAAVITVTGDATLDAGSSNDISLTNAVNDFQGAVNTTANDATLVDANALDLGGVTLTGNLDLTASGDVTDSGTVDVVGTTTIDAGINDITLDSAANDFGGAVNLIGNDATLVDANGLTIGGLSSAGGGNVTLITDSLALDGVVSGTGTFTIVPRTAGTTVGLGGGAGTLNLSDTELARIANGFSSITIGNSTAGAVDIDTAAFNDPLTLLTGGNVNDHAGTDLHMTGGDAVTIDGTLSPGAVPNAAGSFHVGGSFAFDSTASYAVDLNGATSDSLNVGGTTNLAGATLTINLVNAPAVGGRQVYTIVSSTGTLSGTFNGLADGEEITVGGTALTIDYDYAVGRVTLTESGNYIAIIDDGDAGYNDTGFTYWPATSSTVIGYGNDVHYSAALAGKVASWTFTGLMSGQYRVSVSWSEHSNRATDAPYTVMDGSLPLGTVDVNQKLAPAPDVTVATTRFQHLGTFDIHGDTLVVKLSDDANQYVIADAVRIERTGDLPAASPEIEIYKSAGAATIIDDGDPGPKFGRVGSWVDWSAGGYGGDLDYAIGTGGSAAATYTFSGLTAGTYRVSATWVTHLNRATDAPYTIKDGATTISTIDINQELAPDDFHDAGSVWEDLGIFTISGTKLIVELSDDANQYVIADGVRIEPLMEVNDGDTVAVSGGLQTFIIHNSGNDPLVLTEPITVAGDVSAGSFGTTRLATGRTTSVEVSLTGNGGGSIAIANNDADENPFDIDLTGTATGGGDFVAIIDNGDAGYSDTGFKYWSATGSSAQGYEDDLGYSAGRSGKTASWTFTGLTPGQYRVSATWSQHSNRATNAPYAINGGTPILVNQKLSPTADVVVTGSNFQDLSISHTVTGTTLTVSLADAGANGYVIADAIRIERLSPLMAETQAVGESRAAEFLTIEQVDRLYETAVAHWSLTDPSAAARLANVDVRIADLSGALLGLTSHVTDTIWLDTNAAGHGWYVSDQRSAISSRPAMDLLTVLTHELGHVLGHADLDPQAYPTDIMAGRLGAGVQRVPAGKTLKMVSLEPVIDRLFADFGADATSEDDTLDLKQRVVARFDIRLAVARESSIVARDRVASVLALLDERDEEATLDELFAELDEAPQWH